MFIPVIHAEITVILAFCIIYAGLGSVPEAIGILGSVFPWVLLTAATTWRDVGTVLPFHVSVWIIAMTGGNRWAIFGAAWAVLAGHVLGTRKTKQRYKDAWDTFISWYKTLGL